MRWKLWTTILSSSALLAGCVTPTADFCDISRPMYFDSQDVVDWLADNDTALLRDIVSHNELMESCG